MTRLTPKLHSLTTLVSPKSSKCNISMNNGPIALKFCTGAVSIEECIYRVNMVKSGQVRLNMDKSGILGSNQGKYGQIRAIKGKYAQIRVIKPKYSQI